MSGSMIKQIARKTLFEHFVQSVAAGSVLVFAFCILLLTCSLLSSFIGTIGYYIVLISTFLLFLCPMILGVIDFLRRLLWQQEGSILVVFRYFSCFKEYKRAMKVILSMFLRYAFFAFVLYLPCIVVFILSIEQTYTALNISIPVWASNLWTLNSLLTFVMTLAFLFVTLKYYLSPFIFVCNDEIDAAEAINMSVIISKRTGAEFFGLIFSFAGWILLSVLFMPLIFTVPYFILSYSEHSRLAITAYNDDVDRFNSNSAPSYHTDEYNI